MTRKIIQCAQCVTWWYHCTELNECGIMKPQVGFPECMIFDMAMSYFTALHDSSNLHDPWGIKIWGALGGKEDHTMPFANCMGCDFQSYNQIYNWTNMSWNCIVYFLDFRALLLTERVIVLCVYAAHACSFNYKCICSACTAWVNDLLKYARLLMTLIHI